MLTGGPNSDKSFACLIACPQDLEFFVQLFAQCLILLRFSGDSRNLLGRHIKNSNGRKDARQREYKLGLDNFI